MKRRHVYSGAAVLTTGTLLLAAGYWLGRTSRPEEVRTLSTPGSIYVIQELSWRFRDNRCPLLQDEGRQGKPVKAFVERSRAVTYCQHLNLQKRATANPFRYSPAATSGTCLDQYTTMDEQAFLGLVRAAGLTPPVYSRPADEYDIAWSWGDWWEEHRKDWDERLVERLWNALDRLSFYEVVEVALEP
jgi:hypothetical protein